MNVKLAKIIDKYPVMFSCYFLSFLKLFSTKKKREIKNIAIVRLWALGESILTLPMVKRIKEKYPESRITIVCSNKNKTLFENLEFIDNIIDMNNPKILTLFKKFDIAIDAEPFMNIGSLLAFWLGKVSIGYSQKKSAFLYNIKVRYKDFIHVADNFIRLASPLKIDNSKLEELVSLNSKEKEWAKNKERFLKKPIIGLCITTGETGISRRWPMNKWLNLSKELIKKYDPTFIVIGGPEDEKTIKKFKRELNYTKIINTASIGLNKNISLTPLLNLMISSDTGPMHIAAAQQVPTIGLFCPNSPIRFGPLGKKNSYVYKPVLPYPCINVFRYEIPDCKKHSHMKNIQVIDVLNEIEKLNKRWKIL